MVANALLQAGVPGTRYSLWGKPWPPLLKPYTKYRRRWQHVLLKVGPNSYLDGDGVKTELEVYLWWVKVLQITALRPTTAHWHRIMSSARPGAEVPYDARVVDNLAMYFKVALDKRGLLY